MDETLLYHYDPETKQQSMEWRHSGSPSPQKLPNAKIRWKSSGLDFFFIKMASPHLLSSKGPNYQRGVLFNFAGAIEGHFEGKTPRESRQGVLVLARQCPGSPATFNLEETGLPGFQCLDHPPYSPDLAPSYYHLFSGLKKQLKGRQFFVRRGGHCCHGTLVGRTTL